MTVMRTKDVSEFLGTSQTNIKRWASHYPHYFNKNPMGHYVFTEQEVNMLLYIKNQISQGNILNQIALPVDHAPLPMPKQHLPTPEADHPMDDMISRIREVERSLQNKADEVVSVQVLQHRNELEEMRKMIEQIAVSVEKMQNPGADQFTFQERAAPETVLKPPAPIKKRGFFRSFF
jgi:chromosome-anchoring protein RacA